MVTYIAPIFIAPRGLYSKQTIRRVLIGLDFFPSKPILHLFQNKTLFYFPNFYPTSHLFRIPLRRGDGRRGLKGNGGSAPLLARLPNCAQVAVEPSSGPLLGLTWPTWPDTGVPIRRVTSPPFSTQRILAPKHSPSVNAIGRKRLPTRNHLHADEWSVTYDVRHDNVMASAVDDELIEAVLVVVDVAVEVVVVHSYGYYWPMFLSHPEEDWPVDADVDSEVLHGSRGSLISSDQVVSVREDVACHSAIDYQCDPCR